MFDLKDASDKLTNTYQKPGIANVTITAVSLEETGTNKVPFIQLLTESESGDVGKSGRMFLSTEVKPGKKTSGWAVTARNLVDIIMATKNISEDDAKATISGIANKEQLAAKLSAILIGGKLRAKFKGETNEKGNIYATLAQVESLSVPVAETSLRYDASRDIKPFTGTSTTNVLGGESEKTADLPF